MAKKNWAKAVGLLTDFLAIYPNRVDIRKLLRVNMVNMHKDPKSKKSIFSGIKGMFGGGISLKADKAMDNVTRAMVDDPNSASLWERLGDAAGSANFFETSIYAYEVARELRPSNPGLLKKLSKVYEANGDLAKAVERIEEYERLRPNDPAASKEAQRLTGLGSIKAGAWDETDSFRRHLADEDYVAVSEKEAHARASDELEDSVGQLASQIDSDPKNAKLHAELADTYRKLKNYDKARLHYGLAVDLDPDNPSHARGKGDVELIIFDQRLFGLKERYLKTKDEAIKTEIDSAERERLNFATSEYLRRVQLYPTDMDGRLLLGECYYKQGKPDEALAELQKARTDPKHRVAALNMMGQCLVLKGMLEIAVDQFEQAITYTETMNEDTMNIIYNLGTTYERLGQWKEAEDQYKKIFEVDIGFRDIGKRLEWVYKKARDLNAGEQPPLAGPSPLHET